MAAPCCALDNLSENKGEKFADMKRRQMEHDGLT